MVETEKYGNFKLVFPLYFKRLKLTLIYRKVTLLQGAILLNVNNIYILIFNQFFTDRVFILDNQ